MEKQEEEYISISSFEREHSVKISKDFKIDELTKDKTCLFKPRTYVFAKSWLEKQKEVYFRPNVVKPIKVEDMPKYWYITANSTIILIEEKKKGTLVQRFIDNLPEELQEGIVFKQAYIGKYEFMAMVTLSDAITDYKSLFTTREIPWKKERDRVCMLDEEYILPILDKLSSEKYK